MDWVSPKVKWIGNSTLLQIMVLVVPSKSQSGIRVMLRVRSWCLETKVLSMKQCVEPESTRVTIVTEGIKSEVRCIVREFGLERVDALRHSSIVAPIRSTQPWSGTGAGGLLSNFLALWHQSWTCPGWPRLHKPLKWPLCCSPWPCDPVCPRTNRGFGPYNVVSLTEWVYRQLPTWELDQRRVSEFWMYWYCLYWGQS